VQIVISNDGDERKFSAAERQNIEDVFTLFDKQGNGFVRVEELGTLVRALGQVPSDRELKDMERLADPGAIGQFDVEHFVSVMGKKAKSHVNAEADIKEAFKIFDKEGIGIINLSELRHIMTTLGEKLSDEEADEMMADADKDKNGEIDFEEFRAMLVVSSRDIAAK